MLQLYNILIYFLSNLQSRPPNNSRVSNFVSEKVNGWYWVDEFHKSVNVLGEKFCSSKYIERTRKKVSKQQVLLLTLFYTRSRIYVITRGVQ